MGLLSSLRSLAERFSGAAGRESRPQREAAWVVNVTDDEIAVTDAKGEVREIAKADLAGVVIETNDSGPWGSDFWWILLRADRSMACAFPQGATGEKAAMDWLLELPGFDHGELIRASGSTGNAFFTLWER